MSADGVDENVQLGLEASAPSASLLIPSVASAVAGSDDQVATDAASTSAAMLYTMPDGPSTSPAGFPSELDKEADAFIRKLYREEVLPGVAVERLSML